MTNLATRPAGPIQLINFGPEVIASLQSSLSKTMEVMFSKKVTFKDPVQGKTQNIEQGSTVTGIIGLNQREHDGYFFVSFQKPTICAMVGEFYGRPFERIEAPVWEAVGELTNVIYSGFKKEMNEGHGLDLKKSLPGVVIGGNQSVYNLEPGKVLLLPFLVDNVEQRIGLSMKLLPTTN